MLRCLLKFSLTIQTQIFNTRSSFTISVICLEQHIKDQSINNRRRRWKKNVKIGTRVMYSYNSVCASRVISGPSQQELSGTCNRLEIQSTLFLCVCVCVYPTKGRVSSSKPPQPPWNPMGCLNDQSINGMHML